MVWMAYCPAVTRFWPPQICHVYRSRAYSMCNDAVCWNPDWSAASDSSWPVVSKLLERLGFFNISGLNAQISALQLVCWHDPNVLNVFVLALFNCTVDMALQGAWILCSEVLDGARASRCAWMRDGACVDIVIGLLIGAKLLLSTETYWTLPERDWLDSFRNQARRWSVRYRSVSILCYATRTCSGNGFLH